MSRARPRTGRRPQVEANALFHPQGPSTADLHPQLVKQARKSGQLNLTNRGLTKVPGQVWMINTLSNQELKSISYSMDETDDRWWDQVDLSRLNLANNQIGEIPEDIGNLGALQNLDIHDNKLTDLPTSLGTLINIFRLDVSYNALMAIPSSVYMLKELRILLCQNNQIETISEDIGNLNRLEELNLCNNKLRVIPFGIGFLSNVRTLNLSNNNLIEVPQEIGSMTSLQVLDLSNNKLSTVPVGVGDLIHLTQFYLRHNNLKTIPTLSNCTNLKELYCGNNMICEITGSIFESLQNLKILELRDNRITSIPNEIVMLSTLERLDLTNNHITNLPTVLGVMPQLSSLALEGNPLKCIRRDVIQRGTSNVLKILRSRLEDDPDAKLVAKTHARPLSGDFLSSVPPTASNLDQFTLRQSKLLSFRNKQMREIPENVFEIAAECEVNNIVLSKNQLLEVPTGLPHTFKHLKELDLSFNQLSNIPLFLKDAYRLVFLDVRANNLTALPVELSELKQLREVCIANNKFNTVPSCLYSLSKLEILMASDNHISEIDVSALSNLPVLTVLDLKNNDISKVPPELGNLKQLRSLLLEGNVFRLPRPTILAKGTEAILSYLRDRIPS